MPCREKFLADKIPKCLRDDDQRDGVAAAENCTGSHIAGIMHAEIDARKGDGGGHRKHEPCAAAIKKKQHGRGGKPIGGVGGWHAAGTGAAEAFDDIGRERDARTRVADRVFDRADNERVARRDDNQNQQRANSSARTAANQCRREHDDGGERKPAHRAVAAAQDRHEPVENRIAERAVDKMKQRGVERLKPMHRREFKEICGIGKLNCAVEIFSRIISLNFSGINLRLLSLISEDRLRRSNESPVFQINNNQGKHYE